MLEYNLDIEERSTWLLTTQPTAALQMPFHLSEIGKFFAGADYFTKRSGKTGYYLVYTLEGLGRMHRGEGAVDIPPGSGLLIPCTPLHDYHTAGDRWTHLWMHLDGGGVAGYAALLAGEPVPLRRAGGFVRQFEALVALARDIDVTAAAQISHGISALLTDLLTDSRAGGGPRSLLQHPGVEAALRCIQERYHTPLSIDDVADAVNISKYHFVRLFRQQVGATPYQYLLHYRINQSKQQLCTTGDSIGEIAQRVGFAGASNYIGQFRRVTGMTPAQFRRDNINYLASSGREPG